MHTVKAALEEAMATIERVDAHVLMAHVLGVNRAWLAANPMRVLTESEDAKVDMLVTRRALGQPVAYLVEKREFYGRDFGVGPDVLIPRPETETLVEAALARLATHVSSPMPRPSCVDLGTGSGVLAVTLACERPNAAITASDVSAGALEVARRNAEANGGRVELVQGSWYAPLEGRRFDMIVANPPYVAGEDAHLAQGDLRFEPAGALTDGSRDGLDSIRAIVAGASDHLNRHGWLLLEHGYDQAPQVEALLRIAGLREIVAIADLAGIPRVAGGKMS
ncbi:MAG: peptide chain release factor N(5)-glutamine methyltransferase [Usitatibacter sp.]